MGPRGLLVGLAARPKGLEGGLRGLREGGGLEGGWSSSSPPLICQNTTLGKIRLESLADRGGKKS